MIRKLIVIPILIILSAPAYAKENLLSPEEALFIIQDLLRQKYDLKLPKDPDGVPHSSWSYGQALEKKIANDIKKEMNSKNLGIYFLNTYSDYLSESQHGNFKSGIYNVFLMNPNKFLTELSSCRYKFMLEGVCNMLGENYFYLKNPNMIEGEPKIKFNELHNKELLVLKEKDRKLCVKLINE